MIGDDPLGFKEMRKAHEEMGEEFKRLFLDSSSNIPETGDRVVVAAGLIGRGHFWVREEAEVIEVGESSVHVRFLPRYGRSVGDERWIHSALITDVMKGSSRRRERMVG